jgi:CRP/FNR family transcriptional regulator, cyclic AMP receptor protein
MRRRTRYSVSLTRLRSLPGLAGLDDRELARIDQLSESCEVDEGTVLTREGSAGHQAFLVVEGAARVEIGGSGVVTLGPGDFIGEMSLIDGRARSASVVATTPMHLLVFDPRAFASLVEDEPLSRHLIRNLTGRLRDADRRQQSDR